MKLSLLPKLMVFWFHPLLNANVLFCSSFLNLTLCMTKLRVLVLCFSYFTDNSIVWSPNLTIPDWNTLHICPFISSPCNCALWKSNVFVLQSDTNTIWIQILTSKIKEKVSPLKPSLSNGYGFMNFFLEVINTLLFFNVFNRWRLNFIKIK